MNMNTCYTNTDDTNSATNTVYTNTDTKTVHTNTDTNTVHTNTDKNTDTKGLIQILLQIQAASSALGGLGQHQPLAITHFPCPAI